MEYNSFSIKQKGERGKRGKKKKKKKAQIPADSLDNYKEALIGLLA